MLRPGIHSVKKDATNSELQTAIEKAVPMATKQMAVRSQQFKGQSEKEVCKKVFDYLKALKYKADGDEQQIRLPSGLVRTGTGDCKSYALFTSAVLSNLNIPHCLVYTSYNQDPTPTHVYVMTKNGCIVDAVWGKFNSEKQPTYKIKKDMNISYIAGTGYRRSHRMGAVSTDSKSAFIGATKSGKDWAQENGLMPYQSETWLAANNSLYRKYAGNKVLPVAGIGRAFVRKLIEKNSGGFGNSLYKTMMASRTAKSTDEAYKKMRAIEIQWLENGGNPYELYESINEGNSKTPTGAKFNEILKKKAAGGSVSIGEWIQAAISAVFGRKYDPSTGKILGTGIGADPATDAAAAASSAPWWATLISGMITTLGLAAINKTSLPAPGENQPTPTDGSSAGSNSSTTSSINPLYIVAAAGAAYLLLKKK